MCAVWRCDLRNRKRSCDSLWRAMDGIEVMAVIFAKRAGVTVGTFVMVYNIILYIICGCVLQSWVLPLYSIVAYSAALKTVDFIVEGIDRARQSKVCNYCDRVAT